MSILDQLPSSKQEVELAEAVAKRMIDSYFDGLKLSGKLKDIADLMREGFSLGDLLQIKPQHKDALVVHGLRLLQAGQNSNARDVFTQLLMLDPLEARAMYGLAVGYQLENDFETAGQLYFHFLALDATNCEGYLRLGECFLGNQEDDLAKGCFETAKALADRGHGSATVVRHADAMLAVLAERRASR